MDKIFLDKEKIELFASIQNKLKQLNPNSSVYPITQIIKQIPENIFSNKDDFKVLCFLFAYYTRNSSPSYKMNGIKLFEQIITHMKQKLQDESCFLWYIFGGLYYFKLWMYEEGLISIEQIIQSAQTDKTKSILEYFLPEIMHDAPEIYEKQIKYLLDDPELEKKVDEFKELRSKYIKWLRECNDYNDPSYLEIEKNKLRLSIKRDDIDTFQKILSQTNLSINFKIQESSIENALRIPQKIPLIEYAVQFNSIKIFKFLLMNDATLTNDVFFFSTCLDDYEIFHIIEREMRDAESHDLLILARANWNDDVTEYVFNHYNYCIETESKDHILQLITQAHISLDFSFFINFLYPYLADNENFLKENINEISIGSINDYSCYFLNEYLKHPDIQLDYYSEESNQTMLGKAIQLNNTTAVKILVEKQPDLDFTKPALVFYPPLHIACHFFSDIKIFESLCKHPNVNVNQREDRHSTNAFGVGVFLGNIYGTQYLVKNFPDLEYDSFLELFLITLSRRFLMGLKIMLSFYLDKNKNKSPGQIVVSFIDKNSSNQDFKLSFIEEMLGIIKEINSQKVRPPSIKEQKNSIRFKIKRNVEDVEQSLSSEGKAAQLSRPAMLPKPPENSNRIIIVKPNLKKK
ncbi:hypothetical protein M9Y10_024745 [Tritrichomonas musculus]|uniref:DUF3447 domain-containing protein n=1 Tax=Tritrichomonas musculus TaxID=1915356 RepID=A0ABR2HB47_9EUKA